ncbi:MAG: hypothetical protein M9892_03250 [Bacteroidetes bacterium]|nr:hypothetical protein [Bacteroidota bacterium]
MSWLKDIASIVIAVIMWWFTPLLTRAIDPTAGVDDAGLLQRISFAFVALFMFHAFTKIFMRLFWCDLDRYLKYAFTHNFKLGLKWQENWLSLVVYCLLMVCLAMLF